YLLFDKTNYFVMYPCSLGMLSICLLMFCRHHFLFSILIHRLSDGLSIPFDFSQLAVYFLLHVGVSLTTLVFDLPFFPVFQYYLSTYADLFPVLRLQLQFFVDFSQFYYRILFSVILMFLDFIYPDRFLLIMLAIFHALHEFPLQVRQLLFLSNLPFFPYSVVLFLLVLLEVLFVLQFHG